MERRELRFFVREDTNWGPWSEMIESGSPWSLKTLLRYNWAVCSELIVEWQGTKWTPLEFLSHMTKIESKPEEVGRGPMKSAEICSQGLDGIGLGWSNPRGLLRSTLTLWQVSHDWV